ncbi:two-component response regulator ARR14-like [Sesamum indicum]|uniref:Two-component response regulator ARR14-like n=1 Tax=Sesamum indicum TaxID=4182 RepID=A0A6I9T3K4_SESIN|nr:two-component response regulator ARR14-like [Sesamum indicum]
MSQEKATAVPTRFRGLRVLLVDNDTASLLDVASKLEDYSYSATTTELATVALSILGQRKDQFDLVMVDTNIPEMDIFKFIESVQLIKDFPIILMSSELNKNVVEEAMSKGACFFLKKPISAKNLKNVWQHVYRKSTNENIRCRKGEVKGNADQEAASQGAKPEGKSKVLEIVNDITLPEQESEQVGDSDQIENNVNNLVKGKRLLTISEGTCTKRSVPTENNEPGEFKRKRTDQDEGNKITGTATINASELTHHRPFRVSQKHGVESPATELNRVTAQPVDHQSMQTLLKSNSSHKRGLLSATPSPQLGVGSLENHSSFPGGLSGLHKQVGRSQEVDKLQVFGDSSHFSAGFLKLLQEKGYRNEPNPCEGLSIRSKFSSSMACLNQNPEFTTDLGSSLCMLNERNDRKLNTLELNVQMSESGRSSPQVNNSHQEKSKEFVSKEGKFHI